MCDSDCDCFTCRLKKIIESNSNITFEVDEDYSGGDVDFSYYQDLYNNEDLGDSTTDQTEVCGT